MCPILSYQNIATLTPVSSFRRILLLTSRRKSERTIITINGVNSNACLNDRLQDVRVGNLHVGAMPLFNT